MTSRPEARTVVVAEPALQRLKPASVEFTAVVVKKVAAAVREMIQSEAPLASRERRRKNPVRPLRRDFQHHPVAIAGGDGRAGLLHRPPPGPQAVLPADVARARFGWRILRSQCVLELTFSPRHRSLGIFCYGGMPDAKGYRWSTFYPGLEGPPAARQE